MNKQLISILSVVLAIGLAFGVYTFISGIDDKNIRPIQIVPDNAAIILESYNSTETLKNLSDPTFVERLFLNSKVSTAYGKLLFLDSLFQKSEIGDWFSKGQAVYSFHSFSNKSVGFFMAVQTLEEVDPSKALSFLQENFPNRFKQSKRKFNNQEIFDYTDFIDGNQFSIAFKSKLMLFSFDGSLVELGLVKLMKLKGGATEEDPLSFIRKSGDGLNLYLNYKNLPDLLKSGTSPETPYDFQLLGNFAEKALYNIHLDDEYILLKGAAQTHETNFQVLDLLNSQAPIKNTLVPLLPEAIHFSFSFNYNGYSSWFKNVHEYLLSKKLLLPYQKYLDSMETNLQIKFTENLASKFGNNASLFSMDEPGVSKDSSFITAIEIADAAGFKQILEQLNQSYKTKYLNDSLAIPADTLGNIRKSILGSAFKFYFTDFFEGQQANYYLEHEGYFFFANNFQILKVLQQKWDEKKLLKNEKSFTEFEDRLAEQSNLELIINNERASKYALSFVNKQGFGLFTQNMETIKRAQWIGVQFAGSLDKVFASQIYIRFNLKKFDKTEQIWALKLDSNLLTNPSVVFSKALSNQVILVQDALFQLYMIDRDGKVLWKQKLDQKIISPFTEIDLYHNEKNQYVFNTNHFIYVIDENGKNISGWPVWIPTGTNYPVSVFDFNEDGDYEIFATGIYFKASAYSAQGRMLANWNPKDVFPNLKSSLHLAIIGGKKVLHALNEKGQVSFFTPKGEKWDGVKLDSNNVWLDYQLINTDTGNIQVMAMDSSFVYHFQYTNGKSKKLRLSELPDFYKFKTSGIGFTLFFAKNKVLVRDDKDKFVVQKLFSDSSLSNFSWSSIGEGYKLSYYDSKTGMLNVEDEKAIPLKPFPMPINGPYAIGKLFYESDDWLLYGDHASQLFLYRIK